MAMPGPIEPQIDERTIRQIEWTVQYAPDVATELQQVFNAWWNKKRTSPMYAARGRAYWAEQFYSLVKIRKEIEGSRSNRCPECGVKLKVRRCLACDLKLQMRVKKQVASGQ